MVGASVMATWFAAETLMGASSTGYQYGFQGVIFDPFGAAACLFISGFFFTRLMRRARYLTVVDFFVQRYGKSMTVLASIAQLMTYFVWTGAQMVAAGTIVNALFPSVPIEVGMILMAVWVSGYTMLGRYAGRYPAGLRSDVFHCWRHGCDFWLPSLSGGRLGWD